jgi:hypothetical protein
MNISLSVCPLTKRRGNKDSPSSSLSYGKKVRLYLFLFLFLSLSLRNLSFTHSFIFFFLLKGDNDVWHFFVMGDISRLKLIEQVKQRAVYAPDELSSYSQFIQREVFRWLISILSIRKKTEITTEDSAAIDAILTWNETCDRKDFPSYLPHIRTIWKNRSLRDELELPGYLPSGYLAARARSCLYFLRNVDRVLSASYQATKDDIVACCIICFIHPPSLSSSSSSFI